MKGFLRRLGFYLFGIVLGCILVYFTMIKGRTDLPNMWPQGRVKDAFARSGLVQDSTWNCFSACLHMDTTQFRNFIQESEVIFSESKAQHEPAPVYALDGILTDGRKIRVFAEALNYKAYVKDVLLLDGQNTPSPMCDCPPVSF